MAVAPWPVRNRRRAIGLLVTLFFLPVFTSHKTFSTVHELQQRAYPWYDPQHPTKNPYYVQTDQAAVYYPWKVLTRNNLREHGDLPLWDPQSFVGHPLYANSQTGLAYPPRLILAELVSPSWVHDLYLMFHIWLGGPRCSPSSRSSVPASAGALLSGVAWVVRQALSPRSGSSSRITRSCLRCSHSSCCASTDGTRAARRRARRRGSAPRRHLRRRQPRGCAPVFCFRVRLRRQFEPHTARLRMEAARYQATICGRCRAPWLGCGPVAAAAVALLPFLALQSRYAWEPFTLAENLKLGKVVPGDLLHTFVPADLPLTSMNTAGSSARSPGSSPSSGSFAVVPARGLRARDRDLSSPVLLGTAVPVARVQRDSEAQLCRRTRPPAVRLGLRRGDPRRPRPGRRGRNRSSPQRALGCTPGTPDTPSARSESDPAVTTGCRRSVGARGRGAGWRRRLDARRPACGRGVSGPDGRTTIRVHADANPPFQARSAGQLFPDTPAITAVRQAIGPAPGGDRVLPLTGPTGGPPASVPLVWATSLTLDLPSAGGYESALPTDTADLWRFVAGESLNTIRRNQIASRSGRILPKARGWNCSETWRCCRVDGAQRLLLAGTARGLAPARDVPRPRRRRVRGPRPAPASVPGRPRRSRR